MFTLTKEMKTGLLGKLNPKMIFAPVNQLCFSNDCSCKGGCGTYVPPCGSCAYN